MASKETTFSFVHDWLEILKNSVAGSVIIELPFSEELLVTLYYKTDIGSIPRGAQPESYPIPKYKNNPNWSKHIIGCYWCGRDRTIVNGICCTKECIRYFHEWCVERVELFQERRFCKLAGCGLSPTERKYVCCNRSHNEEHEEMFEFIDKRQLRILLIKGPSWYNCEYSFDKTLPVLTPNTPSKLIAEKAVRDLAKQMKSNLIHYTDVGPIPRSYKTAEHSASHFSKHDNWLTDIRGCYLCGMSVTDGCEYLCSNRCYLVFNDWCRRKVLKERGIKYCELPGCEKTIEHQYSFCGQDHLDRRDKYLGSDEYYKLLQKGPHWYNNTPSSTSSKSKKLSTPDITGLNMLINIPQHSQHSQHENKKPATNLFHTPTQSQHSAVPISKSNSLTTQSYQKENVIKMKSFTQLPQSPFLTESLKTKTILPKMTSKIQKNILVDPIDFSTSLTQFARSKSMSATATKTELTENKISGLTHTPTNAGLFSQKLTSLLSQHTDIGVIPRATDPITNQTDISGCYWCESDQTSYNVIACSSRCWYLLHEWCVRKVEHACKLCIVPGCEKSRIPGCHCCSIAHIKQLSKLRGDLIGGEEEVELIIGPIWYKDNSPISFSSKQGPFYELSNFYCCSIQVKNTWPTVFHYLCSQKLYGTPYYRHIPEIESVRELNTFMDSSCVRWVRPDWSSVKEKLTYVAMLHKFKQNSILKRLLLSTNNRQLICTDGATPVDVLMAVRWSLNVLL